MEGDWDDDDSDEEEAIGDDGSIYSYVSEASTSKNDNEYNMLHPRRGKAILFNFVVFSNSEYMPRIGSEKDVQSLTRTLSKLGFQVAVHNNLVYGCLKMKLDKVAREDHSDADCLCVCVMTHGQENGRLAACDREFLVSELWEPFTSDRCKTLAGKPKMFFIQACRGAKQDPGTLVDGCEVHLPNDAYKIPVHSDMLFAYSSVHGFSSMRSLENGTWFMQSLCEELDQNGRKEHLLSILTSVSRRVALNFETSYGTKQMPIIASTLTRLLYFRPLEEKL